jgi:general secretion pathway protein K
MPIDSPRYRQPDADSRARIHVRESLRYRVKKEVQKGIALVLVLWIIALLTVMALGLTTTQRTESALTRNQIDGARFRTLAEAAINIAVLNLLTKPFEMVPTEQVWLPDGMPHALRFDGEELEIRIYNEGSRLDLNQATREQLAALIELALIELDQGEQGQNELERDSLADAIIDWRDADDLTQLNGAEDGDYEAAGLPYGARDDLFLSVDELRQVLGMTRELYQRLAVDLTVEGGIRKVNPQFASAHVLAAIQDISLEDAQLLVDERNAPVVPGAAQPVTPNRGGPLYRIRVAMADALGATRSMESLVEVTGGKTPPFATRWRRYGLLQQAPSAQPSADAEIE